MSLLSRAGRFEVFLLIFVLLALLAYGLTIRDGLDWSEDPAHYIQHAVNLAEGQSYNHLALPELVSGRIFPYPYGLPVVLSLAYGVAGLDLYLFKWIMVVSLVLFAATLVWYARRYRLDSDLSALFVGAAFLANPTVWDMKDDVLSDAPFFLVSILALILYESLSTPPQPRSLGRTLRILSLSLTLVAAYSLRSAALVLPAAIVACEIFRFRLLRLTTIVALIPFGAYLVVEHLAAGSLTGYVEDSVTGRAGSRMFDVGYLLFRLNQYRWSLSGLFASGSWPLFDLALIYGLLAVPAAVGYLLRLIRKPTVFEFFAPIYLAMFVLANIANYPRYMMPLAALLVLYAMEGISLMAARLKISSTVPAAVLAAAILLSFGTRYATIDYARFDEGLDHASAQELFRWIKDNIGEDEVLATQKAYSLRLKTGRQAAKLGWLRHCTHRPDCAVDNPERIWRYLKLVGAGYIVVKKTDWRRAFYPADRDFIDLFVTRYRDYLEPRFENTDFEILAITAYPETEG